MAKLDKWEKQHALNIARYEQEIQRIYATAMAEAARIGSLVAFNPAKPFSFADYPLTSKLILDLQEKMAKDINLVITKGIDEEWALSDTKTEAIVNELFSDLESELLEIRQRAYIKRRDNAREAFKMRILQGLSLSDRVWQYTGQFKEEIEMALDIGLREGKSADELSREVRKYLNNPNMLFRRVRDEHGVLHLSQRAKAYHPGQGVYRSSYKNARRLTATETNIAYRTADHLHRQDLDFVVGIKIQLSNNHTLNGEPFVDICDYLKGDYPKDFKFVGWHPHCRCFVTNIYKTEEERREDLRRMLRGEPPIPAEQSNNYVAEPPQGFVKWVQTNAARTARSLSIPYFMQDNAELVAKIFHSKQSNTNLSRNLDTTIPYISKYVDRDARVAAIYKELDDNALTMTDLEKAMLANRLKTVCANITFADMRDADLIPDGMVMAKIDRDFIIQQKVTYSAKGQLIPIKEVRRDMIVLRDKYGHQFAYPVGTDKDSMLISPASASEQFHSLPRYLTKNMERVSFYNMLCPADKYWKVVYNPNHTSAATDGGQTSFWAYKKHISDEDFKGNMAHEAAHWLDTRYGKDKYSGSAEWATAVNADIQLAKQNRGNVTPYPTKYAGTNLAEDFAESMRLFLTDRKKLKDIAPNRERYLHNLTKYLGSIIQPHHRGTR